MENETGSERERITNSNNTENEKKKKKTENELTPRGAQNGTYHACRVCRNEVSTRLGAEIESFPRSLTRSNYCAVLSGTRIVEVSSDSRRPRVTLCYIVSYCARIFDDLHLPNVIKHFTVRRARFLTE